MADESKTPCATNDASSAWKRLGGVIQGQCSVHVLTLEHHKDSQRKLQHLTECLTGRMGIPFRTHFGIDGPTIVRRMVEAAGGQQAQVRCQRGERGPAAWPEDFPPWNKVCGYSPGGYPLHTTHSTDVTSKVVNVAVVKSYARMLESALVDARAKELPFVMLLEDDAEFVARFVESGFVAERLRNMPDPATWDLAQLAPTIQAANGLVPYNNGVEVDKGWLRTQQSTGGMCMIVPVRPDGTCPYLDALRASERADPFCCSSDVVQMLLQEAGRCIILDRGVMESWKDTVDVATGEGRTTSHTVGFPMNYDAILRTGQMYPAVETRKRAEAIAAFVDATIASRPRPNKRRRFRADGAKEFFKFLRQSL